MRQFLMGLGTGVALAGVAWGVAGHGVAAPEQATGVVAARTMRTAQFENETVKVWSTVVAPGVPTEMHRHDHPRVLVALTDATMEFIDQAGGRERRDWKAGHAYWLPAMPAGALHRDVNAGTEPVNVLTVELEKEH